MSREEQFHRRSIRLKEYNYGALGAYFITICTWKKACLFGEIVAGEMRLYSSANIVQEEWLQTASLRRNVQPDEYIIMPNHFHAILWLREDDTIMTYG